MKKFFIMAIAAAAITSCSQDEVMEVAQKEAITFKDAFVENTTRAAIDDSYTNAKGNLASFQVWGTTKDNTTAAAVNIFNGVVVSATKGTDGKYVALWSYGSQFTQYWIENNYYNFVAIADGNAFVSNTQSNGNGENATKVVLDGTTKMPTAIKVLNASLQKDVLLAKNNMGEYKKADDDETVAFTFDHILSKAKFTAKVAAGLDSKYWYTVSNIKINGAAKKATYTIGATSPWAKSTEDGNTYDVSFGNIVETAAETNPEASNLVANASVESNWDRLLVPEANVNITFDVALHTENGTIDSYTTTLSNQTVNLQPGHAYNFVITLPVPGETIQFTVTEISEWNIEHAGYNPGVSL